MNSPAQRRECLNVTGAAALAASGTLAFAADAAIGE